MQIAAARIKAQQTWQALEVKVPEFAPWAPHGYSRLAEQYARAEAAYGNHGRRYSQTEADKVAADLNAAINTMRPGNLAELEDLGTLLRAVEQAETMPDTQQRREAIEYARMVVKYDTRCRNQNRGSLEIGTNISMPLSNRRQDINEKMRPEGRIFSLCSNA